MNKIILFKLIIITTLFFWTCNTGKEQSCNREPDIIDLVTFNLMNETYQSELAFYYTCNTRESYYRESINKIGIDEVLFQSIIEYCLCKNFVLENPLMAVVLYYDLPLSESLIVSDEHIKGISLYEVRGYTIIHRLYVRNEKDDFVEEENVKVAVPFVTNNHINFYLENYVFSDSHSKSIITLFSDLAIMVEKNSWKYSWKYNFKPIRYEVTTTKSIKL
ncbi:MAG: hypothetical protein FWH23_04890 [Bacteroidales bacterium]|nr:hypothetical protein [Bacteroidales bacterium]MCL2133266.1 hypothetical protein [Bacteroidales bacterium]